MIRPSPPTDWPRLCQIHDAARVDGLRGRFDDQLYDNESFAASIYILKYTP